MPRGGVSATVCHTVGVAREEGRVERARGKGGLQRCAKVGQVQRGGEATQDGAHLARSTLPVSHAEFSAGTDEELRCAEKGAGVSRVPSADLQRFDAAQEANCQGTYTEYTAGDIHRWRFLQTFARRTGRLQRRRQDMDAARQANRTQIRLGRRLPQRNVLRSRRQA